MIFTLDSIEEQVKRFNETKKYINSCGYCNRMIVFSKDEIREGNIVKCPYCGHMEEVSKYGLGPSEYNLNLRFKTSSEFNSESFTV